MLRELPTGQLRGICWPASVGGSSWVWMGALWSPWTTLALLPLPFLNGLGLTLPLHMNSHPRISTFHYRKFNEARKILQSVFPQERCCGVMTAQSKKCLQGQYQLWAVAAVGSGSHVGGSVVVVQTL